MSAKCQVAFLACAKGKKFCAFRKLKQLTNIIWPSFRPISLQIQDDILKPPLWNVVRELTFRLV